MLLCYEIRKNRVSFHHSPISSLLKVKLWATLNVVMWSRFNFKENVTTQKIWSKANKSNVILKKSKDFVQKNVVSLKYHNSEWIEVLKVAKVHCKMQSCKQEQTKSCVVNGTEVLAFHYTFVLRSNFLPFRNLLYVDNECVCDRIEKVKVLAFEISLLVN